MAELVYTGINPNIYLFKCFQFNSSYASLIHTVSGFKWEIQKSVSG